MSQIFYPFSTTVVSEWPGTRPEGWVPHWGTDFAVPAGTPVPATGTGEIVYIGNDGLGGFTIDLLDDNGILHRFGHLTWGSARVNLGQRVTPGVILADSGYSGAVWPPGPKGAHVHWELRSDRLWSWGAWLDPRKQGAIPLGTPSKTAPTSKACCMPRRHRKDIDMIYIHELDSNNKPTGLYGVFVLGQKGTWWQFRGQASANQLASQLGNSMACAKDTFAERRKTHS